MKNNIFLICTYINWSSLSQPINRMRKAKESCIVQAIQIQLLSRCNDRSHLLFVKIKSAGYVCVQEPLLLGLNLGQIAMVE